MPRICIVSPSLKIGGIERSLTTLSVYFARKGNKVFFISCNQNDRFYEPGKNVVLIEPPFKYKKGFINKYFYYIKLSLFIRKNVKKVTPDTILTFGDVFNPLVLFSLLFTKYPVFISDRISPTQNIGFVKNTLKKIFYPRANGIIAQTERAAEYKYKIFGKRISVATIPNALRELKEQKTPKERLIVYAGRLSFEKGPDILINALSLIKDLNDWKCIFAGEGPLLTSLKELAVQKGIINKIDFIGKVYDIESLFAKAKIFVLPSRTEGFPNALAEAMALGCACISTNCINDNELIVNNKNGILLNDQNPKSISSAIEMLINNDNLLVQFSREAKKIKQKLDIEIIGEKYINFILP